METNVVTVSSKHQIAIPLDVRERARLKPGSRLMVVNYKGIIRRLPVLPPKAYRGIAQGMDTTIEDDPQRF